MNRKTITQSDNHFQLNSFYIQSHVVFGIIDGPSYVVVDAIYEVSYVTLKKNTKFFINNSSS